MAVNPTFNANDTTLQEDGIEGVYAEDDDFGVMEKQNKKVIEDINDKISQVIGRGTGAVKRDKRKI
jgi:ribosomal protein L15